jgi:hypothetical protein
VNIHFDIETGPLPLEQIQAQMPEFVESDVKLGNRKDPDVVQKYIEEQRAKHVEQWISRAALSPLTGQVIAIGWLKDSGSSSIMMEGEFDERTMIKAFFALYRSQYGARWVGFNIARFDLPFLVRRAWTYGLEVPPIFSGRYPASCFVDLMQLWQCGDSKEFISLARLARYLGIQGKSSDGSAFAALKYENPEEAIAYLRRDLELTKEIADKIGLPKQKERFSDPEQVASEPFISARQLAVQMGVDRRDVYRLKNEGRIPFVPVSKKTALFRAGDVQRAFNRMAAESLFDGPIPAQLTDCSGEKQAGAAEGKVEAAPVSQEITE